MKPLRTKVVCSVCHKLRIVHQYPKTATERQAMKAELLSTPYVCSDHPMKPSPNSLPGQATGIVEFRDTPIGSVFEQVKHDLDFIGSEIQRKEFKSALMGVDWQIKALQKLRAEMAEAFSHPPANVKIP